MQHRDAWSKFWRSGSLTSFGDNQAQGYKGALRELWLDFFASLDNGSVVVDLGAGNGALEEIATALSRDTGKRLVVHAVDLAALRPGEFGQESGCDIVWHAGTRNEATGLPAASVDTIIGNYAFEYGDQEATAREIARILRPRGHCRFLMHHAASPLITDAANELTVLDLVLAKDGFLDSVRDYLREFGNVRKPQQFEKLKQTGKAEPYRKRMNNRHAKVVAAAATQNAVVLIEQIGRWVGPLVTPPGFFEAKDVLLDRLQQIREELAANRSRLKDMQAAAVDEQRMSRIIQLFEKEGFTVRAVPYHVSEEPKPVGWQVDATLNS